MVPCCFDLVDRKKYNSPIEYFRAGALECWLRQQWADALPRSGSHRRRAGPPGGARKERGPGPAVSSSHACSTEREHNRRRCLAQAPPTGLDGTAGRDYRHHVVPAARLAAGAALSAGVCVCMRQTILFSFRSSPTSPWSARKVVCSARALTRTAADRRRRALQPTASPPSARSCCCLARHAPSSRSRTSPTQVCALCDGSPGSRLTRAQASCWLGASAG